MRHLNNVCLAYVLSLSAVAASADDLAELRELLDPVQNLAGEFSQTIVDKSGKTLQQSTGKFSLKRPGYFYWESQEPFPQTIVGSPDKLWVYDPDLEQATVREQNLNDSRSPVAILTGDVDTLRNTFNVSKAPASPHTEFVLRPKQAGEANYEQVAVVFQNEALQAIRFTDKLQQTTSVQFSGLTQNGPLDATLFEFVPPPGTDIVSDQR